MGVSLINNKKPDRTSRLIVVMLFAVGVMTGCQPDSGDSLPGMPPLPEFNVDDQLPAVHSQIRKAQKSLKRRPSDPERNGHLGMLFHVYRDYEPAERLYHRARVADPANGKWAYLHGLMLEHQGDLPGATDALAIAAASHPDDVAIQIKYANLKLENGEVQESLRLFDELASKHAEHSHILFGLGRAYQLKGESEKAIGHLNNSIKAGGHFGQAYYALALAYRQIGNADKVNSMLELFRAHKTTTPRMRNEYLAQVLKLDASDKPFVRAGKQFVAAGKWKEAIVQYEQAIAINSQNVAAHTTLIGLYANDKQVEKSRQSFDNAIAIDPTRPKAYFNLGLLQVGLGQLKEAETSLQRAIELNPDDPDFHTQMGMIAEGQANFVDAIKHYQSALAISSTHGSANFFLARLYLAFNQPENAVAPLIKLTETSLRKNPEHFTMLAQAYAQQDLEVEAKAAIQAAIKSLNGATDSQLARAIYAEQENIRQRFAQETP